MQFSRQDQDLLIQSTLIKERVRRVTRLMREEAPRFAFISNNREQVTRSGSRLLLLAKNLAHRPRFLDRSVFAFLRARFVISARNDSRIIT